MPDAIDILFLFIAAYLSPAFALLGGSMAFAARSARLHWSSLARGAFLSLVAIGLLAFLGSQTYTDTYTVEDLSGIATAWMGSDIGSLLVLGMVPAIPWLLSGLDRCAGSMPGVSFATPWWSITALLLGLPTLTAAVAALLRPQATRPRPVIGGLSAGCRQYGNRLSSMSTRLSAVMIPRVASECVEAAPEGSVSDEAMACGGRRELCRQGLITC